MSAAVLQDVAESLTSYRLAYHFDKGETIQYRVEHLATVDTKISGTKQVTKSTTTSTKELVVEAVEPESIQFVHSVKDVRLWRKDDGSEEIRFDSRTDKQAPSEYKHVTETIGKPLATITINRAGRVIARESKSKSPDLGFGGLMVPLPEDEVKVGESWKVPKTLRLRQRDGRLKQVKTQMRYRLEQVKTGVATISVKTEVLTPVTDATLKSQLVQQISNGDIKFDIDAGRVISKQLDWSENVIGFSGPGSNMKYLARFTETLIEERTAQAGNSKNR